MWMNGLAATICPCLYAMRWTAMGCDGVHTRYAAYVTAWQAATTSVSLAADVMDGQIVLNLSVHAPI
jgi:hypothetical protein